jgi:hypothetical protein
MPITKLLAKLVKIAASTITAIINTIGGSACNGYTNIASIAETPVSAAHKNCAIGIITDTMNTTSQDKPLAEDTLKLTGKLEKFGLVFNTVPAPVLDAALLAQLKPGCLCIDLASRQGIDLAAAERLGLPNLWATALPGRMVPRTAARAIRDTVYYMLSEGDFN